MMVSCLLSRLVDRRLNYALFSLDHHERLVLKEQLSLPDKFGVTQRESQQSIAEVSERVAFALAIVGDYRTSSPSGVLERRRMIAGRIESAVFRSRSCRQCEK